MIVELTLLSTFIFYHLLLGLFIGGLLWTLFKSPVNISPRTRSMLWFTCYLLITLLPFSAFFGSDSPQPTLVNPTLSQPLTSVEPPAIPVQASTQAPAQATWNVSQEWVNTLAPILSILLLVWFIGILWRVALLLYRIYNSWQLGRNTVQKQQITLNNGKDNNDEGNEKNQLTIWLSDNCTSPMVIGLFNPKILVPKALLAQLNEQQLRHVVLHEQAHIERMDLLAVSLQEVI
ncbi:MAG: hypothetical protein HRT35_23860, partial [Algicola sp.]|nr:hypothetical protein [Algicola sp.]